MCAQVCVGLTINTQDCLTPVHKHTTNVKEIFKVASGVDIDCMKGQVSFFLYQRDFQIIKRKSSFEFTLGSFFECQWMDVVN